MSVFKQFLDFEYMAWLSHAVQLTNVTLTDATIPDQQTWEQLWLKGGSMLLKTLELPNQSPTTRCKGL